MSASHCRLFEKTFKRCEADAQLMCNFIVAFGINGFWRRNRRRLFAAIIKETISFLVDGWYHWAAGVRKSIVKNRSPSPWAKVGCHHIGMYILTSLLCRDDGIPIEIRARAFAKSGFFSAPMAGSGGGARMVCSKIPHEAYVASPVITAAR